MAMTTKTQLDILKDTLNNDWGEYFLFDVRINNATFDKEVDIKVNIKESLIRELNDYLMRTMKYEIVRYSGDCSGKFEANYTTVKNYSGYTQVSKHKG